jgi:hypothetical protein
MPATTEYWLTGDYSHDKKRAWHQREGRLDNQDTKVGRHPEDGVLTKIVRGAAKSSKRTNPLKVPNMDFNAVLFVALN